MPGGLCAAAAAALAAELAAAVAIPRLRGRRRAAADSSVGEVAAAVTVTCGT